MLKRQYYQAANISMTFLIYSFVTDTTVSQTALRRLFGHIFRTIDAQIGSSRVIRDHLVTTGVTLRVLTTRVN